MRLGIIHGFVVGLLALASCKTAQVTKENQPLLSKVTTLERKQNLYQSGYAMYGYDLADKWKLFMNPDSVVVVISDDLSLRSVRYHNYPNQFKNDSEVYALSTGWRMQWLHQSCVDSATKQTFPYQVLLQKDTIRLQGCGFDLYDTRINGKWALTHFNGGLIEKAHTNQAPYIEIDGEKQQISGKLSCNRISGSFRMRRNEIVAGPLATTRMACNDIVEFAFLRLYSFPVTYQLNGNELVLTNQNGEKLQFERAK